MRSARGGRIGCVLGLASLLSGCASSAAKDPLDASGAAGAASSASQAGANESGGTGESAGSKPDGGTAGKLIAGQGGASNAGAPGGDGGDAGESGRTQNIFVAQIIMSQGGGPPACLPRPLYAGQEPAEAGQVSCSIAEFKAGSCDCTASARSPVDPLFFEAAKKMLETSGGCGGAAGVSCDAFCACEIEQASGAALSSCLNELTPEPTVAGFCVIDRTLTPPVGNPEIVATCPANAKRLLRFVGAGQPASDAALFITCSPPVVSD